MANIFETKHNIDNRIRALKSTGSPLRYPKITRTMVHKRLKIGPKFLPTLSVLFRLQSIAHAVSGINVALDGKSK